MTKEDDKEKNYDNWIIVIATVIFASLLALSRETLDPGNTTVEAILVTGTSIVGMIGVSAITIVKNLKET